MAESHENKMRAQHVQPRPNARPTCATSPHCGTHRAAREDASFVCGGRTAVAGPWSQHCVTVLHAAGVHCVELPPPELAAASVEKLLWASIAWLLSAAHGGMPVGELVTHDHTKRVFLDLAMECLELACTDPDLHWQADGPSPADLLRRNQDSVLQGLVDYSLAIHAAVPSVAMAQRELHYRNGYFLRRLAAVRRGGDASCLRSFADTTLHETWLHKAGVPHALWAEQLQLL